MSDAARDPEGRFELRLPPGWQAAPDEDGDGVEVWREYRIDIAQHWIKCHPPAVAG